MPQQTPLILMSCRNSEMLELLHTDKSEISEREVQGDGEIK